MVEPTYKLGVRVERIRSPFIGFGFYTVGERALVISLFVVEIVIGRVYDN